MLDAALPVPKALFYWRFIFGPLVADSDSTMHAGPRLYVIVTGSYQILWYRYLGNVTIEAKIGAPLSFLPPGLA